MPNYVMYDPETGKVQAYVERQESLLPINEIPGDGERNKMVINDELVPLPKIVLYTPTDIHAGDIINLDVDIINEYNHTAPDTYDLLINDLTVQWQVGKTIVITKPGMYDLKITGPWPWKSNRVCFEVENEVYVP